MKKLLGLAVLSLLLLLGVTKVQAGNLTAAKVSLSDPYADTEGVTHVFTFKVGTVSTIKSIRFKYVVAASGNEGKPVGLDTDSVGLTTLTGINGNWAIDGSSAPGNIVVSSADASATQSVGDTIVVTLDTIKNSRIEDCQSGGDLSSDTCYVIISTYETADGTGTVRDTTTVSYTVVEKVTVTAKVDPIFTFQVNLVHAGVVNSNITTSVESTFKTLPFGNLTANVPKYAAHRLNVTTNTQGGYTVDALLTGALTGVYTENNIDPFHHPWTAPAAWTSPTGNTINVNTGFFGANTTDTDIAGWAAPSQKFGGIVEDVGSTVMKGAGSDNGTGAVYVTYAIEANVFQPSDQYTGILVYNALPVY